MSYSKYLISSTLRRLPSITLSSHRSYSCVPIANPLRVNSIDKINGYSWRNGPYTNGLYLQKIDVNDAQQLIFKEKHRLPKDLDIYIRSNTNEDYQMVLTVNKLNKKSSITLELKDHYDLNRNQKLTNIVKISKDFAPAHQPIENAIEGTLKHYIARLQQCIDKKSVNKH